MSVDIRINKGCCVVTLYVGDVLWIEPSIFTAFEQLCNYYKGEKYPVCTKLDDGMVTMEFYKGNPQTNPCKTGPYARIMATASAIESFKDTIKLTGNPCKN